MLEGFSAFVVAVAILAIILVFLGVKSVAQGMEYTVERFGRYTETLTPGWRPSPSWRRRQIRRCC